MTVYGLYSAKYEEMIATAKKLDTQIKEINALLPKDGWNSDVTPEYDALKKFQGELVLELLDVRQKATRLDEKLGYVNSIDEEEISYEAELTNDDWSEEELQKAKDNFYLAQYTSGEYEGKWFSPWFREL